MQFGFKKRNGTKEEEMYWRNNSRGFSKMVEKNANITNIRRTENPELQKNYKCMHRLHPHTSHTHFYQN